MKKYEVYLPLKYNDGQEVEPEKLKEITQQLVLSLELLRPVLCRPHFKAHGVMEELNLWTR
jgi:hypothetical protein